MGDPAWGGVTGNVMNSRDLGTPGHGLVFLCGAGVLACELRAGRAGGDFSGRVSTWHKKLFGGAAGDRFHYVFFHFLLSVFWRFCTCCKRRCGMSPQGPRQLYWGAGGGGEGHEGWALCVDSRYNLSSQLDAILNLSSPARPWQEDCSM